MFLKSGRKLLSKLTVRSRDSIIRIFFFQHQEIRILVVNCMQIQCSHVGFYPSFIQDKYLKISEKKLGAKEYFAK